MEKLLIEVLRDRLKDRDTYLELMAKEKQNIHYSGFWRHAKRIQEGILPRVEIACRYANHLGYNDLVLKNGEWYVRVV
jgi:hypothetical protein